MDEALHSIYWRCTGRDLYRGGLQHHAPDHADPGHICHIRDATILLALLQPTPEVPRVVMCSNSAELGFAGNMLKAHQLTFSDSNQLLAAWAGAPDSTTAVCTGTDLDGTVVARKSLQPSLQVHDLFDDILLLSEGHTVFHGPREEVRSLPVPTCVGDNLQQRSCRR